MAIRSCMEQSIHELIGSICVYVWREELVPKYSKCLIIVGTGKSGLTKLISMIAHSQNTLFQCHELTLTL